MNGNELGVICESTNLYARAIHISKNMSNMEELPEDYYVTQSAFTKALFRDIYPAINPENDNISQKGKVVVITGASQGIGQKV
jgi:hypothetical protein